MLDIALLIRFRNRPLSLLLLLGFFLVTSLVSGLVSAIPAYADEIQVETESSEAQETSSSEETPSSESDKPASPIILDSNYSNNDIFISNDNTEPDIPTTSETPPTKESEGILTVQEDQTQPKETIVTSSTTSWTNGIYIVDSEITINDRVEVSGTVTLRVIGSGFLHIDGGIHVPLGSKLIFDGFIDSPGCFVYANSKYAKNAVIGGNANEAAGFIEIRDGGLYIKYENDETFSGAAIGNGESGSAGEVLIKNGKVGIGGEGANRNGAAIGNGVGASGASITIADGYVSINYSSESSAIGGGKSSGDASILISGGYIDFYTNEASPAPAIGAPIENDLNRRIDVTVTGGEIHVDVDQDTIGDDAAPSIGGLGSGKLILGSQQNGGSGAGVLYLHSIDPSLLKNSSTWNGIMFVGASGVVYGNTTFDSGSLFIDDDVTVHPEVLEALTIPTGASLTIEENAHLHIGLDAALINNGTLCIKGEASNGGGAFENNGILFLDTPDSPLLNDTSSWNAIVFVENDGSLYGSPNLANKLTINQGQTLTITPEKTLLIVKNGSIIDNGAIINRGTVQNEGSIDGSGEFENHGTLNNLGIFFPQLVSFNTSGGSLIDPIKVNKGSAIGSDVPNPVRQGFHFAGWFEDESLTKPWNISYDAIYKPTTLFAKWIAAQIDDDLTGPLSFASHLKSASNFLPPTGDSALSLIMLFKSLCLASLLVLLLSKKAKSL